jgi:hypothetical protein
MSRDLNSRLKIFSDELDEDDHHPNQAPPRHRHDGPALRHSRLPYTYEVTEEQLHEGLNTKAPLGTLASPGVYHRLYNQEEEDLGIKIKDVVHAGGYQWDGILMKDDVSDYRAGRRARHDGYKVPGE